MLNRLKMHFRNGFLKEFDGVDLSPGTRIKVRPDISMNAINVLKIIKRDKTSDPRKIAKKLDVHTMSVVHSIKKLKKLNLIS